jgi:hypothetical protein
MVTQSPIKVSKQTKERIHYLATLLGCSQGNVVDAAVGEYVARHSAELETGLARARQALLEGPVSEISFLLGEEREKVARVSGKPSKSDQS